MDKTLGLGEKLKKLRGRRGLNQQALSCKLPIKHSSLRKNLICSIIKRRITAA